MKNIFFATTNKNKISRLKNFLKGVEVNILSLSDLDYKIDEPIEKGENPVEIAKNKAKYYWDNLKIKYPVISQDDTIEFFDVPELDQPRLSIKEPVIKKYGEFTDTNAIKFYSDIARKYGNSVQMRFNYGFALCNENFLEGKGAILNCTLVSEVSKVVTPGYFLTAIIKLTLDGQNIFYSEMTSEQQAEADKDLSKAINYLLLKIK